ncbi:MAG: thioredoxin [Bacilli bacterium]|nr:thioredoxin [Bacilli bacterium]
MKIVTKEDNFNELIKENLVLVDFFANWCGPCKMLTPHLEELSEEFNVLKVDVDEHEELARHYGIMSIPTLLLFKDGELIDKKVGYQELAELKAWLNSKI